MAFVQCNFFSYQLGMDTEISVLLPEKRQQRPVDRSKDKYKVLYLLHGHSDDHTAYIRKSLIELLVRDKDLVVVMPNAHRGMYTDGKIGHRYFSYIVDELPVVASNFFHASSRQEDSYIAGISMGGYGAAKAALRRPRQYAAAGILSGGMDMIGRISGPDAFTVPNFKQNVLDIFGSPDEYAGSDEDVFALLKKRDAEGGFKPRLYHCCGTEDFIYDQNARFRDAVRSLSGQWDYTYEEGPGCHDWDFWNTYLPRMLRHFGLLDQSELGWMTSAHVAGDVKSAVPTTGV